MSLFPYLYKFIQEIVFNMKIIQLIFFFIAENLSISTNAQQSNFPIRNGIIYAVYSGYTLPGKFPINFNLALEETPLGVCLGIRSLQVSNQSSSELDFRFVVDSQSMIGFSLKTMLSMTYIVEYSKITLSYMASVASSGIFTLSIIPSLGSTSYVYNGLQYYRWFYYQSPLKFTDYATIVQIYFIPILVVRFPQSKFNYSINSTINNLDMLMVDVGFPEGVTKEVINVSAVLYNSNSMNYNQSKYIFQINQISLYSGYLLKNIEDPICNIFWGLTSILPQALSSKIHFSFQLFPQSKSRPSYQYLQINSNLSLLMTQESTPTMTYIFTSILWARVECLSSTSTQYLDYPAQICYDICPFQKYSNFSSFCVYCNTCSDTKDCLYCYTNGCEEGYYFTNITSPFSCNQCSSILPNCSKCSADYYGVYCIQCDVQSSSQLILGNCITCPPTAFIDYTGKCVQCNTLIPNCETCAKDGSECFSCFSLSYTELINGGCQLCSQQKYYDSKSSSCKPCNYQIQFCLSCSFSGQQLRCDVCDQTFGAGKSNSICEICNSSSFVSILNNTCQRCSQNCIRCSSESQCLECDPQDTSAILISGQCLKSNDNYCSGHSLFGVCTTSNCFLLPVNEVTNKCQFQSSNTLISALSTLISIPTINIFTNAFVQLIGVLDDLTYYVYHKANYSHPVEQYIKLISEISFARFIPQSIQGFLELFDYSNKTLTNDFSKTPLKFQMEGKGLYFVNNTVIIWTCTLPITIFIYLTISFVHWVLSHWISLKILKPYQYYGMILVSLIGTNIQYLAFQCFTNLFQTVVEGVPYNMNLVLCYFILLIVLIYSLSTIFIFKFHYTEMTHQYILCQLLGQFWRVWFVVSNFLKIATAFVHSYFYYDMTTQAILLCILYILRMIGFAFTKKYIVSQLDYCMQLLKCLCMFILQCFFLTQILLEEKGTRSQIIVQNMGVVEVSLVLLMIANKTLGVIIYLSRILVASYKSFRSTNAKPIDDVAEKGKDVKQITQEKPVLRMIPRRKGLLQAINKSDKNNCLLKSNILKQNLRSQTLQCLKSETDMINNSQIMTQSKQNVQSRIGIQENQMDNKNLCFIQDQQVAAQQNNKVILEDKEYFENYITVFQTLQQEKINQDCN